MKRRLSAVLAALFLLTALLPAASAFSDVPYSHWAWSYINKASSQDWVKGTGGDFYTPERTVTAAEFFTMVVNAFFQAELAAQPQDGAWYTPAWNVVQALNLHEGTFVQEEAQLTELLPRQDMAQIISNVLTVKGLLLPSDTGAFSDWEDIPSKYRSAVTTAAGLGILNGKENGNFAPADPMTRAEAAAVLCRMDTALYPIEVIRLVNIERANAGLGPVALDPVLMEAAQIRAAELKELFDHTRPNGQPCATVLADIGVDPYSYYRYGENIATGFSTPESVVNGWMNSPSHRMNIMTEAFTLIGVGYDSGRWVQIFGRK